MIFFDTSVLIAIAQTSHVHHTASLEFWERCNSPKGCISAHSLAELYSTLTAMPPALRISPAAAVLTIETFLHQLTAVTLTVKEYTETVKGAAKQGCTGGMVYDALHTACARKVGAERIYTWNVRHFQLVAPDLADRIVTP